ncbi:MAG: DUF885 family protein [Chryseolinea sp.]
MKKTVPQFAAMATGPAHKRTIDFLEQYYLKSARESSGSDGIPAGKAYHDYLIKYFTTTTMSADEIFAPGKSEADRFTKDMVNVKDQIGFKGEVKSFLASLRTKKQNGTRPGIFYVPIPDV